MIELKGVDVATIPPARGGYNDPKWKVTIEDFVASGDEAWEVFPDTTVRTARAGLAQAILAQGLKGEVKVLQRQNRVFLRREV